MTKKMTALIIMDGFGERAETYGNAIKLAGTPNLDRLEAEYPHTHHRCERHGRRSAGRPDGQQRGRPHSTSARAAWSIRS